MKNNSHKQTETSINISEIDKEFWKKVEYENKIAQMNETKRGITDGKANKQNYIY